MDGSIGELSALGTAVFWAVSAICFTWAGRAVGSGTVNLLRLVLATLFLSVALWAFAAVPPWKAPADSLAWLAVSGVIGLAVGDGLYFEGLVRLGPRLAMTITALWPVFSAGIGWLLLDETLGGWSLAGIGITVACIAWVASERASAGSGGADPALRASGILLTAAGTLAQAIAYAMAKVGMRVDPESHATLVDPLAATWIRMSAALAALWLFTLFRGRAGSPCFR